MCALSLYQPDLLYRDGQFLTDSALVVEGDRISAIGPREQLASEHPNARVVDWPGMVLLPGAVNVHCHSFQSLLRGFVVDAPFDEWRDHALYRYAPYLDEDAVYAGALLSFGEMLRYGVTTVADFFYVHGGGTANDEAVIRAARDLGIRLVFARTLYDWEGAPEAYRESVGEALDRTRALASVHDGDPMISVCPAPHSLHGASAEMVQAGHRLARELGTRFHIHVAEERYQVDDCLREHGCRPVQYLDRLGVLDGSMLAVHLCWLDAEDIALLGEREASLAYCPSSNMFLADGVTPLPELLAAGVRAGLGTDGLCSNNRASIVEEMRMASLLQKVHRLDATSLTVRQVFDMGTRDGAALLDLPTGQIATGYLADFIGLDLRDLSMQPAPAPSEALLPNVVYASQPTAVQQVVVGGREVVRDGTLLTLSAETIAGLVQSVTERWPSPEGDRTGK